MGLQIRTGLKSNHRIRGGSGLFAARPQMPDRGSAFDCDECRPFAFLQIGWEAGLPPPSPHTTGRTVPYHGGWNTALVFRHRL
jgi:hypothetical protein